MEEIRSKKYEIKRERTSVLYPMVLVFFVFILSFGIGLQTDWLIHQEQIKITANNGDSSNPSEFFMWAETREALTFEMFERITPPTVTPYHSPTPSAAKATATAALPPCYAANAGDVCLAVKEPTPIASPTAFPYCTEDMYRDSASIALVCVKPVVDSPNFFP